MAGFNHLPGSLTPRTWFDLQEKKAKERERTLFLLNNDLLSDIKFIVSASNVETDSQNQKSKMVIPAHKFLLAVRSPVFFAMFCGEMAEKSDTIDLPDCEYDGVLEMLRYLYSEEVELNDGNVLHVLYLAKKYILPSLADECIVFLLRQLTVANVLCVLSHAKQYEDKPLVDRCWEMIDRETEAVVKSEEFVTIDKSFLESIVKRDTLTISELQLFKAVDHWAVKKCEMQGLATDGDIKRRILGEEIVKNLRFPVMEERESHGVVLDSKILTDEEKNELFYENLSGKLVTPGFPEFRRTGTYQSCCRFGTYYSCAHDPYHLEEKEMGCRDYDGKNATFHTIALQVDRDVWLYGIRLLGCAKGLPYQVTLKIAQAKKGILLLFLENKICYSVPLSYSADKINGFDVLFDPFVLKKNVKYVVRADVDGPDCCYGKGGVDIVKCGGVTFHFKNYQEKKDYSETNVQLGQFAEFFFKPLEECCRDYPVYQ